MPHAKQRIILAVTLAEHGGVQEFLVRFAKYLQTQGHEVTITAGEGEWLFSTCQKEGIPTHKLKHMRRAISPWHDVLAIFELNHYFEQYKPDAVHLNSSKMGAIGSLAARQVHIPRIVYRIGGWVFLEPLPPLTSCVYRLIEQVSARWKDTIICVHPGDLEVAKKYGILPRKELVSVPNGIDLPTFEATLLGREAARTALNLNQKSFVFGTIANLFPAKDLPHYLEACKIIHDRHPNTKWIILGEGPERQRIEEKQKTLGLENTVLLPGQKNNASQYLKAFDAFVLPSSKEGMSWALLEAMAANIPCLATTVGANEWLLQKAGELVPPHQTQALVAAMESMINHPIEGKAKTQQAYERIKRDFPLQKTFEENEKTLVH